jgi:DNA-binding response OmpR family regulator
LNRHFQTNRIENRRKNILRKAFMRSACIGVEDSLFSFTPHTIDSLSRPYGIARVVTGEPLQAMELALLRYFREHSGRTLSREELAEQVWKQRYFHASRAIDQTVAKLRKKLRRGEGKILSVWSEGYRFESDNEDASRHSGGFPQRTAKAA